jgi:hypothetical protein
LPNFCKLPTPNKAIVTSRCRTGESAITVRLDRLAEPEALELMRQFGQRHPRVAQELDRAGKRVQCVLYETVGGNPLALDWALGLVARKGHTLDGVLRRLSDVERVQDLYAFLFADAARDLAESDRVVLSAISVFQAPADANTLVGATGLAAGQVRMALERLVTLSLVNDLQGGRLACTP